MALSVLSSQAIASNKTHSKPPQQSECKRISRADAITHAKKQTKGKVVGVQFRDRGSRSVYQVRMLVGEKRVKTMSIRACR